MKITEKLPVKQLFILAVVVQLAVLGFMIGKREYLLTHGQTVKLQCEPVDPRSLFSGDYVILRYTISDFNTKKFTKLNIHDETITTGDTIYLSLVVDKDGISRRAREVSKNLENLDPDKGPIIRGKITSAGYRWRIKYGLESYFVPQGQGKPLEKIMDDITVEAALSKQGEAAMRKLLIGGFPVTFY